MFLKTFSTIKNNSTVCLKKEGRGEGFDYSLPAGKLIPENEESLKLVYTISL